MTKMKMRKSLPVLAILFLLCVPALAKDRVWRNGKLLDTSREHFTTYGSSRVTGEVNRYGEFEGHSTQSSWGHDRYTFAVEDESYIYVLSTVLSWRWSKEAKVTVNAPIKFAIEGDKAYILDDAGREHKLRVEKTILKDSPSKIVAGQDVATPPGGSNADQNGVIAIDSGLPGSEIELDGAFVGNTPAKLRVTAGPHRIAVKSGWKVWEKNIQVLGGSVVTLQADLGEAGVSVSPAESTQEVSKTTEGSVSGDQHSKESDAQSGKKIEGAIAYIACSESASEVPFSSSARSRKTLKCGEKVTILDRSGNWVRIRTADNVEGNVSSRFISQHQP